MSYRAIRSAISKAASPSRRWTSRAPRSSGPNGARPWSTPFATRRTVVKSDLIAEAILANVKKNKCDLVVMASHGRRGLKRILLGSETQQVLTHSTVPVLVLR